MAPALCAGSLEPEGNRRNRRCRRALRTALRQPPAHALPIASSNRRRPTRGGHRRNARSLLDRDTISIVGGLAVYGLIKGGGAIWEEIKTPNGTVVAVADIVVDSIDGETTIWYTKRDEWAYQSSHDEDNASEWNWNKQYEFYEAHVSYVQWYQERYCVTDAFYIFGGFYWPSIINQGYNYGWTGDFETGKTGYLIEMGQAKSNYILHAFDSKVNRDKDQLLARQDNFTYAPEVDAEVSDMRYNGVINGWSFTRRSRAIHRAADKMSAEDDAYQTVQILSTSMRLDDWEMAFNKSKVYWRRQTKTIPAGHPGTGKFSDGSTMPANMPFASDLTGPFPKQEITHHN